MTQGQDVTDVFIIHHLNEDKARQTLSNYYVGETSNKLSRFSFEENGLYRTVKRRVLSEMTLAEIQSTIQTKRQAYFILSLFIIFLGLTTYLIDPEINPLWSYLTAAISGLLIVGILGIGHNFVHHK